MFDVKRSDTSSPWKPGAFAEAFSICQGEDYLQLCLNAICRDFTSYDWTRPLLNEAEENRKGEPFLPLPRIGGLFTQLVCDKQFRS